MGSGVTNKLTIYLIKSGFNRPEDIVDSDQLPIDIPGVGQFVYDRSHPHPPDWLHNFFGSTLQGNLNIINSSAKGVLVVPVQDSGNTIFFAVVFGVGRHLLKDGVIEERFGLKVVLNSVEPESFRSLDKTVLGSVPKHSHEQMSRDVTPAEFGIDIEQDLLSSITGKSRLPEFGKMLTGKDSLSVSPKVDVSTIKDFFVKCYERYKSSDYKQNFEWVDQIADVRDPVKEDALNNAMLAQINAGNLSKIWMAVPELINWSDLQGFRYGKPKRADLHDDLSMVDFINTLKGVAVTTDILKGQNIFMISAASDDVSEKWSAYRCTYAEVSFAGSLHILTNGKWYSISDGFTQQIINDFSTIPASTLTLPDFNVKNEDQYNQMAAGVVQGACCMDKKLIIHGGGKSSIEFCDLLTDSKKVVHVKRYGGSSVLSHLFTQGVVSAELFAGDGDFRQKLNAELPSPHKLSNPADRPKLDDYEIVYAVISKDTAPLDIPFFSKVSLRNARRRLLIYGYKVSLNKIQVV